jgi:hypothetical protein
MDPFPIIFFVIVIGFIIFSFTNKGKSKMLGGNIIQTFDAISTKQGLFTSKVKVHVVDTDPTPSVSIEVSKSSPLSYQMLPATLTADEAKDLAELLMKASEYKTKA